MKKFIVVSLLVLGMALSMAPVASAQTAGWYYCKILGIGQGGNGSKIRLQEVVGPNNEPISNKIVGAYYNMTGTNLKEMLAIALTAYSVNGSVQVFMSPVAGQSPAANVTAIFAY